ncbi:hypothetical protein B0H14DRAFT_2615125 [Mycena olivaceomarginata]|nr:hypothetical protein B0H14DRAFT_2615125 [Mycena olivaceomarginata]
MPPWMMQAPPPAPTPPTAAVSAPTPSPPRKQKFPAITEWLEGLDSDEDRGADSLNYQQYGGTFADIGIIRLDDLLEVETAEKLQELAKMNWGTAKRLIKFAKEDNQKLKKARVE